jgi:hypothetical protein
MNLSASSKIEGAPTDVWFVSAPSKPEPGEVVCLCATKNLISIINVWCLAIGSKILLLVTYAVSLLQIKDSSSYLPCLVSLCALQNHKYEKHFWLISIYVGSRSKLAKTSEISDETGGSSGAYNEFWRCLI